MSFSELGLSPELCTNLSRSGYVEPTAVQAASIPRALEGNDLLVGAQTGTGKTAAFALPILQNLLLESPRRAAVPKKPIALVLTPTRELAHQVYESFRTYGAGTGLKGTAVFGGADMYRQIEALRRGVHVLVATPGRLIDHMSQKKVQLSSVEYLVLDEADRMLDMGFLPDLERIIRTLPRQRQTWLFSATFAPEVRNIASQFMNEPERIQIEAANSVAATIRHQFHPVDSGRKREMLVHILADDVKRQTLVFCRTKNGCDRLTAYLDTGGFRVDTIHGDKTQNARLRALRKFKEGRVDVLVATDVAARGLDIQELPIVVNYDLPMVPSDYIHRIGRTGRAGSEGQAVSLVSTEQLGLFRGIQRMLETPVETGPLSGFDAGTKLDLEAIASGRPSGRATGRNGYEPSYRTNSRKGTGRPYRNGPDADRRPRRPESPRPSRPEPRYERSHRPRRESRFGHDNGSHLEPRFDREDRPGRSSRFERDNRARPEPRFERSDRQRNGSRFERDNRARPEPRFERSDRQRNGSRSERDNRARPEPRFERSDRPRNGSRFERDNRARPEPRFERSDRPRNGSRFERDNRARPEPRSERSDRTRNGSRFERDNRARPEPRSERSDRTRNGSRFERDNRARPESRFERSDRPRNGSRLDREHGGRPVRAKRHERTPEIVTSPGGNGGWAPPKARKTTKRQAEPQVSSSRKRS